MLLPAQEKRSGEGPRIIHVDFNKINGKLNTMFKECIGAGRANEALARRLATTISYGQERL